VAAFAEKWLCFCCLLEKTLFLDAALVVVLVPATSRTTVVVERLSAKSLEAEVSPLSGARACVRRMLLLVAVILLVVEIFANPAYLLNPFALFHRG
jgi:hypothetical protein